MTIICCCCKNKIGEANFQQTSIIEDGLCPSCYEYLIKQIENEKPNKIFDYKGDFISLTN